jgi:hypothetical protein
MKFVDLFNSLNMCSHEEALNTRKIKLCGPLWILSVPLCNFFYFNILN